MAELSAEDAACTLLMAQAVQQEMHWRNYERILLEMANLCARAQSLDYVRAQIDLRLANAQELAEHAGKLTGCWRRYLERQPGARRPSIEIGCGGFQLGVDDVANWP